MEIKSDRELDFYCPKCKSKNVVHKYMYSSIYGHLPMNEKDYCRSCGFTSESFYHLNLQTLRDEKLEEILKNKDGIQ